MRALTCASPGPWQVSHCTPAVRSKPFLIWSSGRPKAVTWHLRHLSSFAGSLTPFSAPVFLAASLESVLKASECLDFVQQSKALPLASVLWHSLHFAAPM